MKFLGHLINAQGVLPDPDNVQKIVAWPTPTDVKGVQAILGMGNYYCRFIKGYSQKMQPLINLTKEKVPFEWTPDCEAAFNHLKQTLIGPQIMANSLEKGEFILNTDASLETIGAVLSQVQNGREHVIAYGSHTLSPTERNYCVTDRELLAVLYFTEYYRHYLKGCIFTVRTDHQALRWLFSLKKPKDRIACWIVHFSEFTFSVEYRPGNKHSNADVMSR